MLGDDVEARLAEVFAEEHQAHLDEMRKALARYTGKETVRVQLAIITLSRGEPEELFRMVDAALGDYRDVLFWAEYPDDVNKTKKKP